MDYRDHVHTLMAAANWVATDKLTFNLGVAYSMSESEIKDVYFESDPHTDGDRLDALTPWMGTYDLANTNEMSNYSRLEYDILNFDIEAMYAFSEKIDLSLKYILSDVDDREDYVYGDQTGWYQSVRAWLTYKF